MSNANGAITTYYDIKTLDDGDLAGYTSLNEVTTSIDTQLNAYFSGIIVLYNGVVPPIAGGWTDVDAAIVAAGGPASGAGYIWIKKD